MPISAPATPFDLVVFDFDGTLVDSAAAKRAAFFEVLPATFRHRKIIADILAADPGGSRFAVIPRMVAAMRAAGLPVDEPDGYIRDYGSAVLAAVAASRELPGATALLRGLRDRCVTYLCSATPEEPLRELIAQRQWSDLIDGIAGYPHGKPETLTRLIKRYEIPPARAAMVGDGDGDEFAAKANGCAFFRITAPGDLAALARRLGAGRV